MLIQGTPPCVIKHVLKKQTLKSGQCLINVLMSDRNEQFFSKR